jgi:hypothetical protein
VHVEDDCLPRKKTIKQLNAKNNVRSGIAARIAKAKAALAVKSSVLVAA